MPRFVLPLLITSLSLEFCLTFSSQLLVRMDMDVNGHERLYNNTLRHKLK